MIKNISKRIRELPNADSFYLSQLKDGVSIGYAPCYPDKTPADFSIWIRDGKIRLYSPTPTLPIVKDYKNLEELFADLRSMEL